MYQEKQGKTRVVNFDSIAEFTKVKTDSPRCIRILEESIECMFRGSSRGALLDWYGAGDRDEYDDILKNGHPRYIDMIDKDITCSPPESIKRRLNFGDSGDEVCIHKINSGNFSTAWRKRDPKARVGARNIKLVVNIGNHCGVGSDKLQWIGVTALTVALAIESAGYNLAIEAALGSDDITDDEDLLLFFPVKHYESPLDIQALSSVLCFPGFFRGAGFMNFGLAQGDNFAFSSLGTPPDDSKVKRYLDANSFDKNQHVEIVSNECLSEEKSKSEIKRILNNLGNKK